MSTPRAIDGRSEGCGVVMFAMDARADRRISLAAGSLADAGYDVRMVSAGSRVDVRGGMRMNERSLQTPLRLKTYRYLRDNVRAPTTALRALYWRIDRRPERVFLGVFKRAIAENPATVYVAHDLPMLPVALAAAERHGGKVLFDSHELYPDQEFSAFEGRLWREVEARYIARADAVIAVNPSIAGELARRNSITTPTVVENCDHWRAAPQAGARRPLRRALDIADDVPLVLYQGGLSHGRNLETLVKAFALIEHPTAVLAILGDGPVRGSLERAVLQMGLAHRVRFHRAVSQELLPAMTESADFGVIPYQPTCLNNYYCTPNKLYEYIMARLPIVATDLPELRRIVVGTDVGIVGDTHTPELFSSLIDHALVALPPKRQSMQVSLERAASKLCWEAQGQTYVDIVDELVHLTKGCGHPSGRRPVSPLG